jgi:hypothetical protein
VLLALTTIALPVLRQQPGKRGAGAPIPVRYLEGAVHGFLELRTATGAFLATGDALQIARDDGVEARMVFHFPDSSHFEETVKFAQQGVFVLQSYHLVQNGPAFANDLDATLARSGDYVVKTKSHKDGTEKKYVGKLDLPADVYNGMVITIAKNLARGDTRTVHIVAFTPEPHVVGLEIAPAGTARVMLGLYAAPAVHFKLKPKLGALRVVATVAGKAPPDSDLWLVTEGVPGFVRFEGPMFSGPVWRLSLTSPTVSP